MMVRRSAGAFNLTRYSWLPMTWGEYLRGAVGRPAHRQGWVSQGGSRRKDVTRGQPDRGWQLPTVPEAHSSGPGQADRVLVEAPNPVLGHSVYQSPKAVVGTGDEQTDESLLFGSSLQGT
jgi:hypothetical protein